MEKKPNHPNPEAFAAVTAGVHGGDSHYQRGMSLRDYFAAEAMPAILKQFSAAAISPDKAEAKEYLRELFAGVATSAYLVADAMLAERIK